MRVVVYHGEFGCETGCCGHYAEIDGTDYEAWTFDHPDYRADEEAKRAWAIEFAQEALEQAGVSSEHSADLDWENSYVYVD